MLAPIIVLFYLAKVATSQFVTTLMQGRVLMEVDVVNATNASMTLKNPSLRFTVEVPVGKYLGIVFGENHFSTDMVSFIGNA
jgi:hypothetical protein